ncbi:MAG: tRNA lysidine(34) synthetase TilS [Dehalococcoidia bacterium]|nr:tRNA lysidine(34) synthetase TilS [Dehalococcoidia bacterium]
MTPHARNVERFARENRLFRRVKTLLVAVSGGPDSLAALLLLRDLRERFGFDLIAAHFDHKLREGSADDLAYVREVCQQLDILCLTGEGDVRESMAASGAGMEEAARRMRYQFLAFIAGQKGADAVATGHTRDDQVETVLHRIIRGSGARGLRGMLPRSPLPGAEAQLLVRPLLELTRKDTRAICEHAGIQPLDDPSNDDTSLLRNRLRHETLPYLRTLNASVDDALLGLAESARELFAPIEEQAMRVQPHTRDERGSIFTLAPFAALPSEALTLVIEREASFSRLEPEINRTRLHNFRSVLKRGSGEVHFGELCAEVSCGQVRLGPPPDVFPQLEPLLLNVPGVNATPVWRVEALTEAPAEPGDAALAVVSLANLQGALRIRSPLQGDRVAVLPGQPRLSDVLVNAKVPRWDRRELVVVADGRGVVAVSRSMPNFPRIDDDDALWLRFSRTPHA